MKGITEVVKVYHLDTIKTDRDDDDGDHLLRYFSPDESGGPTDQHCHPRAMLPPFINHFNTFTENFELCDLGVCQNVKGGDKNPFRLQSQNGTSRREDNLDHLFQGCRR